ncbi:hypothetical protein CONLIGDRAFT_633281 [Coniochaeta ligniaria NRRL 30616]|uniref:Amine oxidase n=1 Tax=Coniochaeta ligniaria NRRL 30616 TaxID=1408157 RepID=A0A1J7J756_9PEZI|nr:hypothetical protein CONLIGDRAFT_633281 [Coniochaeta ligniaria NRRL 30616]
MFTRRSLTAGGVILTLFLCVCWLFADHQLSHGAQHSPTLAAPASEMTLSDEDHVRIVQRSPSPEVQKRYDAFIKQHASVLHMSTMRVMSTSPGYSLSLVYFQDGGGGGNWGLLVSYETMTDEHKHKFRHYLPRLSQPLDPNTNRFLFAIAPRLRFGRLLSARGSILAPKVTGENPSTLTGALYISSDPNHSGSTITIGGTIVSIDEFEERRRYALTLCMVWDGLPATANRSQEPHGWGPFQAPVVDRAEGEILLDPLDVSDHAIVSDELDPVPADRYQHYGSAATNAQVGETPINLDHPLSLRGVPWCLVTLDDEANYPSANTLSSGEAITLSETEPAPGSVLYVATAAELKALPRCTLLDLPNAWVEAPYTIGPSRSRQFQMLPGSRLHRRDIGAWILQETSDGLKACYQIVALGEPDIVYAVPLKQLLRDVRTKGVATLPGTMDNVPYIDLFYWMHPRETVGVGVAVEHINW